MSESKGPRPVAWRVGAFSAEGGEGAVSVSEFGEVRAWPADVAEARAYALIMAAAVARGEQGHTAALNRVSVALGHGHITADHGSRRTSLIGLQDERSRVVEVLVDAGIMAHGGDTAEGVRSLVAERDRLRRDCDAAAEACGVAVVGHVPEAWRLLSEARDEAVAERDAAREALAASRHALGVVGNGSPVLAAWSLRHECSALREDLAAAEAARAEAVQEAARLRAELAEVREALVGKTMHDAAAEVVAPLRAALKVGDLDPSTLSPADVVSHTLFRLGLREVTKPTREPMTHTSLASIEQHGVVVGDRITLASDANWARVGNIISNEGLLMSWSATGAMRGAAFKSAVVEATDAD